MSQEELMNHFDFLYVDRNIKKKKKEKKKEAVTNIFQDFNKTLSLAFDDYI